jgi:hypothetical protein
LGLAARLKACRDTNLKNAQFVSNQGNA